MKHKLSLFLPIAASLILNSLLLGWAASHAEQTVQQIFTRFPAFGRPQANHTLVACFLIFFAFFLLVPFEAGDLPAFRPGSPLYELLDSHPILCLMQASILVPMALHVSARLPINNGVPLHGVLGGYILTFALLAIKSWTASSRPGNMV